MLRLLFAGIGLSILCAGYANAAENESCRKVRFSDVGWTDITATTATASVMTTFDGGDAMAAVKAQLGL